MTHVEELHRDLLQAPEHFATLFHASTCIIQFNGPPRTSLWRNVEGRHLTFLKLLARGRLRSQQQVFQTKACEPFTTLQPAELIQFCGRPCALVVAEYITILQRVEEARFALAQTFDLSLPRLTGQF
jgi:hypothetical protein